MSHVPNFPYLVRPITEFITGSRDSNRPIMCYGKIRYYCKILYVSTHECCLIKKIGKQKLCWCVSNYMTVYFNVLFRFSSKEFLSSFFFTCRDMFLEFLVHTDENVNVYSWEKVNEDN